MRSLHFIHTYARKFFKAPAALIRQFGSSLVLAQDAARQDGRVGRGEARAVAHVRDGARRQEGAARHGDLRGDEARASDGALILLYHRRSLQEIMPLFSLVTKFGNFASCGTVVVAR